MVEVSFEVAYAAHVTAFLEVCELRETGPCGGGGCVGGVKWVGEV